MSTITQPARTARAVPFSLVLLIYLSTAIAPSLAGAAIAPGRGIGGVEIGNDMRHVREAFGKPARVVPPTWRYDRPLHGGVRFNHGRRVNDIWTRSRRQRTPKGIGPGSSMRDARQAYPKLRCRSHSTLKVSCLLNPRERRTHIATAFLFRRHRLSAVDIFLVPQRGGKPVPK